MHANTTKALIAVVLLAMGVGCRSAPPRRTPVAAVPPWIGNERNDIPADISVPAGQVVTIDSPVNPYYLIVGEGARVEASSLTEVGGGILVRDRATLVVPHLKSSHGFLIIGRGAEVVAPELTKAKSVEVGMRVDAKLRSDIPHEHDYAIVTPGTLPVKVEPYWISIGHDVFLISPVIGDGGEIGEHPGARVEAQSLTSIWGIGLTVGDDASLIAPSLRVCSVAHLGDRATFDAPCAAQTSAWMKMRKRLDERAARKATP